MLCCLNQTSVKSKESMKNNVIFLFKRISKRTKKYSTDHDEILSNILVVAVLWACPKFSVLSFAENIDVLF